MRRKHWLGFSSYLVANVAKNRGMHISINSVKLGGLPSFNLSESRYY